MRPDSIRCGLNHRGPRTFLEKVGIPGRSQRASGRRVTSISAGFMIGTEAGASHKMPTFSRNVRGPGKAPPNLKYFNRWGLSPMIEILKTRGRGTAQRAPHDRRAYSR